MEMAKAQPELHGLLCKLLGADTQKEAQAKQHNGKAKPTGKEQDKEFTKASAAVRELEHQLAGQVAKVSRQGHQLDAARTAGMETMAALEKAKATFAKLDAPSKTRPQAAVDFGGT